MTTLAARLGDNYTCNQPGHGAGTIKTSASAVFIENKLAARVGDVIVCQDGTQHVIKEGSSCVFIEGMPAARLGDAGEHDGCISNAAKQVFIGTNGNSNVHVGKNVYLGGNGKMVLIGGKII